MRILLAPFGSRGDVEPLLALGQGLRERGHDVRFAASATFGPWISLLGFAFHDVGGDVQSVVAGLGPARVVPSLVRYLREGVRRCFEATADAAAGTDLVVATIHLAARSVAEAKGIPCRTVLFTTQMLPSRFHPPPMSPWVRLPAACNRALWWGAEAAFDLLFRLEVNRERRRLGLGPIAGFLAHARGPDPIVASDAVLAPLAADAPGGALQVGAFALRSPEPLAPDLARFLDDGDPPVYFGFGSTPDPRPARTARIAIDACRALGRRLVLCGGWAGTGGVELPPGAIAVASAPHGALFPRLAAVVHHGGAGTTAAAMRAGVPQVVVPHLGDQLFHGRKVADGGLGPEPLPRRRLGVRTLADRIARAEECRDRAREVARMVEGDDGVARAVEAMVGGG